MSATPLTDATIKEANKSGIFRAEVIASMSRQLELDRAMLLETLRAIAARIDGEWDHPALVAMGPLNTNTISDVALFAETAIDKITSRTTQIA
jgi:hypothetical protein